HRHVDKPEFCVWVRCCADQRGLSGDHRLQERQGQSNAGAAQKSAAGQVLFSNEHGGLLLSLAAVYDRRFCTKVTPQNRRSQTAAKVRTSSLSFETGHSLQFREPVIKTYSSFRQDR